MEHLIIPLRLAFNGNWSSWTSWSDNTSYTGNIGSDGIYKLQIKCKDSAGNQSNVTTSNDYLLDRTAAIYP